MDLADYKASLKIGQSAWNNVQQLLSKAFNRAIIEGIIEVNPLKRAPDVKRMKVRRPDERPLDIPDIEALANAATNARDRLEIFRTRKDRGRGPGLERFLAATRRALRATLPVEAHAPPPHIDQGRY